MSTTFGLAIVLGQMIAGFTAERIGHIRYQCMVVFVLGGLFPGCAAVSTPDNESTAIALIFLGLFFMGWNELICLTNSTILVKDQSEIGIAGGTAGSVRAAVCAVLVAIYVSIQTKRLEETSQQVPPELLIAGLPESSVLLFLQALQLGKEALAAVPDATGYRAYQEASTDAYRTVYLATIAFSGLSIIFDVVGTEH